jgi:hypothetical protein
MRNFLITWFYSEHADDESFYPSVGGNCSGAEFQYVYWRCVYVFYRSALITNQDVVTDYLFFTNVENLPTVDGVNFKEFFEENGIQVIRQELTRKTPKDWYGAWRNQFYVFDVLENLKNEEGNFLILDSDCVITRSLQSLYEDIASNGIVTLPIDYSDDRGINGCSINQMRSIYRGFFGGEFPQTLGYMGGEMIAIASSHMKELLKIAEAIWEKNYALYESGTTKLNEEAHILSLCYYCMNSQNEIGRKYIRRIWTALNFDNVVESDVNLPIWHLPAEKKFGFRELFRKMKANQTIDSEQLLTYANKTMKIQSSRIVRKINWYIRYGIHVIRKVLRREDNKRV